MRIGHGYDVHRYKEGRRCVICGVEIPCGFGPDGHSDADVPVHALMDGILGAAALGDIGKQFPDSDEQYKGISSILLLKRVVEMAREKGYRVSNADVTIVAQKPKMAPYIEEMRQVLAETMEIAVSDINVKATTEEGLGFTGAGLGMAAHAVVLLDSI